MERGGWKAKLFDKIFYFLVALSNFGIRVATFGYVRSIIADEDDDDGITSCKLTYNEAQGYNIVEKRPKAYPRTFWSTQVW